MCRAHINTQTDMCVETVSFMLERPSERPLEITYVWFTLDFQFWLLAIASANVLVLRSHENMQAAQYFYWRFMLHIYNTYEWLLLLLLLLLHSCCYSFKSKIKMKQFETKPFRLWATSVGNVKKAADWLKNG